jgi:endonuclease/exonuclease/phosphatase family metal-dependent hydrolase
MADTKKFTRRAAIGTGLSLLGAGGAVLAAAPAAAATTVRVMSWNIHGESVSIAGIASVIEQYGVDVATLQEVHRREDQDQVALLAGDLNLHISNNVHFGPSDLVGPCDAPWTGSRAGWAGNAVFSRYPIVERVTKALSPASQDCPVKRAMSGVRLNVEGKVLRVFTTHLTPGASAAALNLRHAQTTTVVNYLTQSGPLLLTGDFNDTPVSWVTNRVPAMPTTRHWGARGSTTSSTREPASVAGSCPAPATPTTGRSSWTSWSERSFQKRPAKSSSDTWVTVSWPSS